MQALEADRPSDEVPKPGNQGVRPQMCSTQQGAFGVATQQGAFGVATERVREEAGARGRAAAGARQRAQDLRDEAVRLERPFEQLKRRRLQAEADDYVVTAERLETEQASAEDRIGEYTEAFGMIGTSSGGSMPPPPADVHTDAAQLPPGTVASSLGTVDSGVNFHEWLEQRDDVSSIQDTLIGEMIHELVGEVAKARVQNSTRCSDCNRDLVLLTTKALLVCPVCGVAQSHLDATPSCVAYDEGGRREMYSNFTYTYKRANHLFERIAQMQAVSASVITPELMATICIDLHQRRVRHENVTAQIVKDILKKRKLRKTYEFVVPITRRLQGKPPIAFTRETLEKLKRMFEAVQRPFERHCPRERANFLSYWYVLYKFLELLGAYDVLPYLTLLKGKMKLLKMDAIWRKICSDLGWEYIPSI
jgi:hypothetical protein